MKFDENNGNVKTVPITARHTAVGSAPYSFTSGFEPTEYTLYMKAAIIIAIGQVICREVRSAPIERTNVPASAKAKASISEPLIFSFKKIVESSAMNIGPKEMSRPARPADTMVSA